MHGPIAQGARACLKWAHSSYIYVARDQPIELETVAATAYMYSNGPNGPAYSKKNPAPYIQQNIRYSRYIIRPIWKEIVDTRNHQTPTARI